MVGYMVAAAASNALPTPGGIGTAEAALSGSCWPPARARLLRWPPCSPSDWSPSGRPPQPESQSPRSCDVEALCNRERQPQTRRVPHASEARRINRRLPAYYPIWYECPLLLKQTLSLT